VRVLQSKQWAVGITVKSGLLVAGFCSAALASCASSVLRYTGGPHGAPTLVDARAEAIGENTNQPNRNPRILKSGNLAYPTWAMMQHVCGTITIVVFIGKDGKPNDARVESRRFNIGYIADPGGGGQYTVAQIFDSPAINFVLSSEFSPALVNAMPEGMWVRIPVKFNDAPEDRCHKPK